MSLTMENHKNSWIFAWNFFKFANISCGSSSRFSPWLKSQGGDAYTSVINLSPAFSSLATYLEGSAGSFISSSRAIGRYIEAGGGGKIDSPMGIFWDSGLVAPTLPPVFSFSRASTAFFSFDVSTTAIFLKFSISGWAVPKDYQEKIQWSLSNSSPQW